MISSFDLKIFYSATGFLNPVGQNGFRVLPKAVSHICIFPIGV